MCAFPAGRGFCCSCTRTRNRFFLNMRPRNSPCDFFAFRPGCAYRWSILVPLHLNIRWVTLKSVPRSVRNVARPWRMLGGPNLGQETSITPVKIAAGRT